MSEEGVIRDALMAHLNDHEKLLLLLLMSILGRFLNHSCDPNIFVQNIFQETHDLRSEVEGNTNEDDGNSFSLV